MPELCPRPQGIARGIVAVTLVATLLVAVRNASASVPTSSLCCQPRPQDSVWLVDSRCLASCDIEQNVERLKYWRYDREQGWVRSALPELLASDDPDTITTVFLHGNRIPTDEAFTKGWMAYRKLTRCADERPIRFVIWSWPSDKAGRPIEDARIKASRTNPAGYYVAWFVDQLEADAPVSLWGHSFGARIATGALHLLGGGDLCGMRLEARVHPQRAPMQVALLAAAMDDHWLLPGHFHGQAMTQVRAMLLINNSCDRLLRRYQLLYPGRGCEQALGYNGLAIGCLNPDDRDKVTQVDACCQVGSQHLFSNYVESPDLLDRMRGCLLWEDQPTSAEPLEKTTATDEPAVDLVVE